MINIIKIRVLTVRYIKKITCKFIADGTMFLASSIAYYFLFSIFPLMLILLPLTGLIIDNLNIQASLQEFMQERIPIIYDFTRWNVERVIQNRRSMGILGIVFLILGATYVFDSLQFALNKIYKTPSQRKFWQQKAFGFLIICLVFVLLFLSFVSSALVFYIARTVLDYLELGSNVSDLLIKSTSLILGLIFNFIVFCLLYYFGTNRRMHFNHIYKGALFGAAGWEISKHVFIFFINTFSNFSATYGSLGSIISFLMWVFISTLILLIGAQINSVSIE